MKSRRVYQLARKLQVRVHTVDQSHQYSHSIDHHPHHTNIFNHNIETPFRQLDIHDDRTFELTGAAVIFNYSQAKKRKRKDAKTITLPQKYSITTHKSARDLVSPVPGSIYLTKDEVLGQHTPKSPSAESQSHRKITQIYDGVKKCSKNEKQRQEAKCNQSQSKYLTSSDLFSVARLKQLMQQYRQGWARQSNRSKQSKPTRLQRHKQRKPQSHQKCQSHSKYNESGNSKYSQVVNRKQRRQGNSKQGQLGNCKQEWLGNSRFVQMRNQRQWTSSGCGWTANLRDNGERANKQLKQMERILTQTIAVQGRSKLKKQTLWIQDSHERGYFFAKLAGGNKKWQQSKGGDIRSEYVRKSMITDS